MIDTPKARIFKMLDSDKDGVISKADYRVRTDRAARAMGRADDDPVVAAARAANEALWADMDANADGWVTFEEYDIWAGPDAFERVCRRTIGLLFDIADLDGDGTIDRSEFTRLREASGNPPGNAAAAFDVLDTDHDGYIGRDDYLAAIRDYVSGQHSPMAETLFGITRHEPGGGREAAAAGPARGSSP